MLKAAIVRTVAFCTDYRWGVIVLALILTVASVAYTAQKFAINTDVNTLISAELPFRKRELEFEKAFPRTELIVIVMQAATPERAKQAAGLMMQKLSGRPDLFRSIRILGGGKFFEKNGLLFLSTEEVDKTTKDLVRVQPVFSALTADPTLRGIMDVVGLQLSGVQAGQVQLDALAPGLKALAVAFDRVLEGRPVDFTWRGAFGGAKAQDRDRRVIIDVDPVLDFGALEPGMEGDGCHPGGRARDQRRRHAQFSGHRSAHRTDSHCR